VGIPTFSPLFIGLSGLQAMQQAESVVGNNIDNANTPGYAQETVNFQESNPYPPVPGYGPVIAGQMGQGVQVGSIVRQDDAFYDYQDRENQSTYQLYATESSVLTQVEGILNEPSSNSLQNALDQFFSSWQTLSTDPSDTAARQAVITQGQILAQTFNTVVSQLQTLRQNLANQVNDQINQFQQYAQELDQVNQQIAMVSSYGENPNQLLDQQSKILDEMAELADTSYTANADGMVTLTGNAAQLASVSTPVSLTSPPSAVSGVSGGQIAGNVEGYNQITGLINNLDAFMENLANEVNSQLSDPSLSPPLVQTFFTYSGGTLSVAMTSPDSLQTGQSGASGDNSYVLKVVQLQNTSLSISWTDGSGATQTATGTMDQLLASMVSNIGMTASGVASSEATANALLQQSTQLRQSISGVSLDEQASYMISYQNAYAAAAKYITTFQAMMQSLLNMVQP